MVFSHRRFLAVSECVKRFISSLQADWVRLAQATKQSPGGVVTRQKTGSLLDTASQVSAGISSASKSAVVGSSAPRNSDNPFGLLQHVIDELERRGLVVSALAALV